MGENGRAVALDMLVEPNARQPGLDLVVPEREEATDRAIEAWYNPFIA
jgi:hypothetical protein